MPDSKVLTGNAASYPIEKTLGQFFFDCGDKHGDKICQIDANTDQSETYASVKTRSVRLAIAFQKKNITSKTIILVCSNSTMDNSIPLLAAFYLGAKGINLSPTVSVRNARYLISLLMPDIIFVEEPSTSLIEDALKDSGLTPELIVFGNSARYQTFSNLLVPSANENKFRPIEVDRKDTGIMFFSSGTTGYPKVICHSHENYLRFPYLRESGGSLTGSVLHFSSFYGSSAMFLLATSYLSGGTRIFSHDDVDGESILKLVEKYKIASIFMAPVDTYKLTRIECPSKYDTSSLRSIRIAGTAIDPEQFQRVDNMFENCGARFGYGMSEAGCICLFHPVMDRSLIKTKPGSCGKAAPTCAIKVVDPDTQEVLGPNREGEIRVKSPNIMQGYYKLDSCDCFDGEGFFKTGDVGRYDEDGCFYVVGRLKEMFKYLARPIMPQLIEKVLMEHPAVKEAVVYGVAREEQGEAPAACVVLKEGVQVHPEQLETFVADRVSDKEKLRGGVVFVESLPRTPTGKVIRKDVQKLMAKAK